MEGAQEAPVQKSSKIALWAIMGIVFLIPLLFIPHGILSISMTKMFVLVLGVVIGLIGVIKSEMLSKSKIPQTQLIGSFICILGAAIISALFSAFPGNFLGSGFESVTVGALLLFGLLFIITVLTINTKGKALNLYLVFFTSVLLLGIFHTVRLIGGVDVFSFGVFTTTTKSMLGGWPDMASFFGLGLLCTVIALDEFSFKSALRYVIYILTLVSFTFLVIVNIRLVWVLVVFFGLLYVGYRYTRIRLDGNTARRISKHTLVFVVLASIATFFGGYLGDVVAKKMDVVYVEAAPSVVGTYEIARNVYDEHLFIGTGPNTFDKAWATHRPIAANFTSVWNSDFMLGSGYVPTLIATGGLLSFFAWLGWFVVLIRTLIRVFRVQIQDEFGRFVVVSSGLGTVYLWVFAYAYAPSVAVLTYTFLFTGIFVAALGYTDVYPLRSALLASQAKRGIIQSGVLILCAVVICLFVYGYSIRFIGTGIFNTATLAFDEGDMALGKNRVEEAISWYGHDVFYRTLAEINSFELANYINDTPSSEVTPEEVQRRLGNAITAARTAVEIDTNSYQNWITLGRVYANVAPLGIEGAPSAAMTAFNEAERLNSKNPRINLLQAQLLLGAGDTKGAEKLAIEARRKKPDYLDAIALLSQLALNRGDEDAAIAYAKEGVLLADKVPVAYLRLGLVYYELGQWVNARNIFRQGLGLEQKDASFNNIKFYHALALYETGDTEGALAELDELKLVLGEHEVLMEAYTRISKGRALEDSLLEENVLEVTD